MVGECPEVEVSVRGKRIPCILDTGSQVTLFSRSFFQKHFCTDELRDAGEVPWLTLKAANGLNIQYVGYAVLDFEVGGVQILDKGVVIVKDSCLGADCGILGMNVIADCLTQVFQGTHPGEAAFRSTTSPRAGAAWTKAFAACRRALTTTLGPLLQGVATLEPQPPVVLPPEMEVMLWTQVPQGKDLADCLVIV